MLGFHLMDLCNSELSLPHHWLAMTLYPLLAKCMPHVWRIT